jgi:S-adenosylmethionine:tRNA ribosyltransferase-isomerase
MVIDRAEGSLSHRHFFEVVDYLREGDVLVFNDSRVIPARLRGRKTETGGRLEILLLRRLEPGVWEALVGPWKRVRLGSCLEVGGNGSGPEVTAEVVGLGEGGTRLVRFSDESRLSELGEIPLPPYIRTPLADSERYQTVYARWEGSVAAPTAGLHFTPPLMADIASRGVDCLFVTLHVGLDTFRPVRESDPTQHAIHREYGVVSRETVASLSQARREGRRIICVGTTTVRLVEAVAQASTSVDIKSFEGWVDLFILPGFRFQVVDAMITNFHLPRSTLLMLVMAFAGKDLIGRAYREAITWQYRFYSFGDATLIL